MDNQIRRRGPDSRRGASGSGHVRGPELDQDPDGDGPAGKAAVPGRQRALNDEKVTVNRYAELALENIQPSGEEE